MSSYHGKQARNQQKVASVEHRLPARIEVSLEDLGAQVRQGLLDFSVAIEFAMGVKIAKPGRRIASFHEGVWVWVRAWASLPSSPGG